MSAHFERVVNQHRLHLMAVESLRTAFDGVMDAGLTGSDAEQDHRVFIVFFMNAGVIEMIN